MSQALPDHAFVADFERERPRLTALARGWLGGSADAQDAVQDTWLRAARDPAALPGTPAGTTAWLVTALKHVCIDRLRRRRLEARHAETLRAAEGDRPSAPSAEALAALHEEARDALRTLLDSLSPADAAALLLHAVFDYEHAEIAALAGVAEPALRQRVHRALRRVRTRAAERPGREAARDDDDSDWLRLCWRALQDVRAAALVARVARPAPTQAAAGATPPHASSAPRVEVRVVCDGDAFGLAWVLDGVVCCVVPIQAALQRPVDAAGTGGVAA